jgi:pimeloyl-ACP methyl ester carboxylesterase
MSRTLHLRTADGERLAARYLPAPDPAAVVVLVHGFTGSIRDRQVAATAEHLRDGGYAVVAFDARGHGASTGRSTLGDLERHDVDAAVRFARAEHTQPVVVVGASMGAVAALRHATSCAGADGLVLVSCPARWDLPRTPSAVAVTLLTRTPPGRRLAHRWLRVRVAPAWTNPPPPAELIGALRGPVAIVHGQADRFIGPRAARDLHDAAGPTASLRIVPGMGHGFDDRAREALAGALAWVVQRLGDRSVQPA